jgi:GDP/UDP-N,N'-diacetylbacillosamine 2-epimerase (hydrolysing)
LHGDEEVDLKLIVTGSHLSKKHGFSITEIDFLPRKHQIIIDTLDDNDSTTGVAKSMALTIQSMAEHFELFRPDILVVLGDRFEILSVVIAAQLSGIPVAHIHGGEVSEGAIDESFRHSITKMSHVHFVAANEYRKRVIQLGENPDRVYLVGGMGADAIYNQGILSKGEIEKTLGIKFRDRSLLVTFHPVTLELSTSGNQLSEMLFALSELKDTTLIFTMPNADVGYSELRKLVEIFTQTNKNAFAFDSLGSQLYLSCMFHTDGVVGNSSSGLLEAPSMHKGSINIGDRQRGRLTSRSVINCAAERGEIGMALKQLFSLEFTERLHLTESPYGTGGASEKIHEILKNINLEDLIKKKFYDLFNE